MCAIIFISWSYDLFFLLFSLALIYSWSLSLYVRRRIIIDHYTYILTDIICADTFCRGLTSFFSFRLNLKIFTYILQWLINDDVHDRMLLIVNWSDEFRILNDVIRAPCYLLICFWDRDHSVVWFLCQK